MTNHLFGSRTNEQVCNPGSSMGGYSDKIAIVFLGILADFQGWMSHSNVQLLGMFARMTKRLDKFFKLLFQLLQRITVPHINYPPHARDAQGRRLCEDFV